MDPRECVGQALEYIVGLNGLGFYPRLSARSAAIGAQNRSRFLCADVAAAQQGTLPKNNISTDPGLGSCCVLTSRRFLGRVNARVSIDGLLNPPG